MDPVAFTHSFSVVIAVTLATAHAAWVRFRLPEHQRRPLNLLLVWVATAAGSAIMLDVIAPPDSLLVNAVGLLWTMTLPVLLAYALLRYQMLGVRLRVKRSFSRGLVAGSFLATFAITTQLAENVLNSRYDWLVGGVATGALVFALSPLQRLADRAARAAMPDSKPESEMRVEERLATYEEHLRIAWSDGTLGAKERRLLQNLRTRLGLEADAVLAIEDRLAAESTPPAPKL